MCRANLSPSGLLLIAMVAGLSPSLAATDPFSPQGSYDEQVSQLIEEIQSIQDKAISLAKSLDEVRKGNIEQSKQLMDQAVVSLSGLLNMSRESSDLNKAIENALNWSKANRNRVESLRDIDSETKSHLVSEWDKKIERMLTTRATIAKMYRNLKNSYGALFSQRRVLSEYIILANMEQIVSRMEVFATDLASLSTRLDVLIRELGISVVDTDSS